MTTLPDLLWYHLDRAKELADALLELNKSQRSESALEKRLAQMSVYHDALQLKYDDAQRFLRALHGDLSHFLNFIGDTGKAKLVSDGLRELTLDLKEFVDATSTTEEANARE